MGEVWEDMGIEVVRLHKKVFDLTMPLIIQQLIAHGKANPGVSLWVSIPCTVWCSWQHMNVYKRCLAYVRTFQRCQRASLKLVNDFFAARRSCLLEWRRAIAYEWPKDSIGWGQDAISRFNVDFGRYEATYDGCAFGMTDVGGHPVLKPWRVVQVRA